MPGSALLGPVLVSVLAWSAPVARAAIDDSYTKSCRMRQPVQAACADLDRAEQELAAGRAPEAAAFALRAEQGLARERDAEGIAAARWLRAEALARARRSDAAIDLFTELARSGPPALRRAAGLMAADVLVDTGRAAAAHETYERLLPGAPLDPRVTARRALRAADAAAAAGDTASVERWLSVVRAVAPEASDEALVAAARLEQASARGDAGPGPAVLRAARSPRPEVSREGRLLVAAAFLGAGDSRRALHGLERLLADGVPPRLGPALRATLARALDARMASVGGGDGCHALVSELGARLPRLARAAGRASLEGVDPCRADVPAAELDARTATVLALAARTVDRARSLLAK